MCTPKLKSFIIGSNGQQLAILGLTCCFTYKKSVSFEFQKKEMTIFGIGSQT